jgi:hypothetical protein
MVNAAGGLMNFTRSLVFGWTPRVTNRHGKKKGERLPVRVLLQRRPVSAGNL